MNEQSAAALRILDLLHIICTILDRHNERFWSEQVADIQKRLKRALDSGSTSWILTLLEEIRELYGGMGSFGDIFITHQAGHDIEPGEVSGVNSRFQELQDSLYLVVTAEIDRLREG